MELYPGLFMKNFKARMNPGSDIGIPYTAGRAVLSDAVDSIRGDRFVTMVCTCFIPNWDVIGLFLKMYHCFRMCLGLYIHQSDISGYKEVEQDYLTFGGSKLHHLIHRAFPT